MFSSIQKVKSQNKKSLDIIFGSGFIGDTCILVIQNNPPIGKKDTIWDDKIINSSLALGLAYVATVYYPSKNTSTSIIITINNKLVNKYTFDKIKNDSELLIEFTNRDFLHRMDKISGDSIFQEYTKSPREGFIKRTESLSFYLKQKGKFIFE